MFSKNKDITYLCVIIILLILSYRFLDNVRKVKPKFSIMNLIVDFNKRIQKNNNILKGILSGKERKLLASHIDKIKKVIKDPRHFTKPCFDIDVATKESLSEDHIEIQKLLQPLRNFVASPRVKIIINEMATDYEALINLSRNSFCQKI